MEKVMGRRRARGSDGTPHVIVEYQEFARDAIADAGYRSIAGARRLFTGTGQAVIAAGDGVYRIVGTGILLFLEEP